MPAVIIVTSPRRRPRRVASRAQAAAHLRERHDADHRARAVVRPTTATPSRAARRVSRAARVSASSSRGAVRVSAPRTSSSRRRRSISVPRASRDEDPPAPLRRGGEDEPDRDEDGLYIGTYSNFFTDPDQIKGVSIFCAFLATVLSLGNVGAAILLPILYDQPIQTCIQGILFGYYCPP